MAATGMSVELIAYTMHSSKKLVRLMLEEGLTESDARGELFDDEPAEAPPGCKRCHLRGNHSCVPGIDFYAEIRRGE